MFNYELSTNGETIVCCDLAHVVANCETCWDENEVFHDHDISSRLVECYNAIRNVPNPQRFMKDVAFLAKMVKSLVDCYDQAFIDGRDRKCREIAERVITTIKED